MWESLGAEGIWKHALGGGHRRDIEEADIDGKWHPDVTSGQHPVQSNG